MSHSEEISRAFYARLGADGLANRTRPEWTERIVAAVLELLGEHRRVLDVGCGYGRIAVPLARVGYEVAGLDLSENLIEAARRAASAEGLSVRFTVGSMASTPYRSDSFDTIIRHDNLPVVRLSRAPRGGRAGADDRRDVATAAAGWLWADRGTALRGAE